MSSSSAASTPSVDEVAVNIGANLSISTPVASSPGAGKEWKEIAPTLPALRVLTLGDGNFSFSAAIVGMHEPKRIRKKQDKSSDAAASPPAFMPSMRMRLCATSFDSRVDLTSKYPEAAKLCEKIIGHKKEIINRVEHDVDATHIVKTLLPKLLATQSSASSVEAASATAASLSLPASTIPASVDSAPATTQVVPEELKFDVIIFNHPHSGKEDLALHGSLLAHFFHSANQFLSQKTFPLRDGISSTAAAIHLTNLSAQVHVTLCMKQPEDWKLIEHARAQGFELLSRSEFLEASYAGYETKRHHINKTFARKSIERMELFIFQRTPETHSHGGAAAPVTNAATLSPRFTTTEENPNFSHNLLSHVIAVPAFHPTLPLEDVRQELMQKQPNNQPTDKSTPVSLLTTHICPICQKGFASERGLHFHKIDVHENGEVAAAAATSSSNDAASTSTTEAAASVGETKFECRLCEPIREFKNEAGYQQHIIARHTQPDLIKGSVVLATAGEAASAATATSAASSLPDESVALPQSCPICQLKFTSIEALDQHLEGGVPPVSSTAVECDKCGRQFSNQRGLNQHLLVMNLTPEKHVRIVAMSSGEAAEDAGEAEGEVGKGLLGGAAHGKSKMRKLRGMVVAQQSNPENSQSVVQRLGVKLEQD